MSVWQALAVVIQSQVKRERRVKAKEEEEEGKGIVYMGYSYVQTGQSHA